MKIKKSADGPACSQCDLRVVVVRDVAALCAQDVLRRVLEQVGQGSGRIAQRREDLRVVRKLAAGSGREGEGTGREGA